MRRLFITIKTFAIAALAVACILFAYVLFRSPVFADGDRYEFYRGTSSEEIVLSRSPYEKLFLADVRGESARYSGNRAQEIMERFGAQILFTEEAAGVVNYYCYSPFLKDAVSIGGVRVNLHIACDGEETAAGTPIIFGGF